MKTIEYKKCSTCKEVKLLKDFGNCSTNKDGLQYVCKVCRNLYRQINKYSINDKLSKYYSENKEVLTKKNKERYLDNKDLILERNRQYRIINKDKVAEINKSYCVNNKENIKNKKRQYYLDNKQSIIEYQKKYYIDNKEKVDLRNKQYVKNNKHKVYLYKNNYTKTHKERFCKSTILYNKSFAKYKLFFDKLTIEELPILSMDGISLEVVCKYCGKYFKPTYKQARHRVNSLLGKVSGDGFLYCSQGCKDACPIFYQKKYPKGFKKASSREVDSFVRQLCFERDGWRCVTCSISVNDAQLHCHHIEGYTQNPILGNDIYNVITLCKVCHEKLHSLPGCKYHDMMCNKS